MVRRESKKLFRHGVTRGVADLKDVFIISKFLHTLSAV